MTYKNIAYFLIFLSATIFGQPNGTIDVNSVANVNDTRINQVTNLRATSNGNAVTLRWDWNSNAPIAGTRVYRSETGHEPWVRPSGGKIFNSSARSFVDNDPKTVGKTYYYAVEPWQTDDPTKIGRALLSTFIRIKVGDANHTHPDGVQGPTNLVASRSGNNVVITWRYNPGGLNVNGFKIERITHTSVWEKLRWKGGEGHFWNDKFGNPVTDRDVSGANARSFTDPNVGPGTYGYRVFAYNASIKNYTFSENVLIRVTDGGSSNSFAVSPSNRNVSSSAGNTSFSVASNVNWTVNETVGWLSINSSGGSNNGTVTVAYQENGSTSSRTGTITFNGAGTTRNVTVTQSGKNEDPPPPSGDLIPQNVTATVVGGTITVKWEWPHGTANISGFKLKRQDNNSGPWMRPAGGKIANPNARSYTDEANLPDGTYSYLVHAYLATTSDQNLPLSQTAVAVISSGGSSSNLTVNPTNRNVSSSSGSTSFSVTSNVNWTVSVSVGWLNINSTNGSNNGTVTVNYQANGNTSSRTGTVTIAENGGGITRNVTVTQSGRNEDPPSGNLVPQNVTATVVGGTITVKWEWSNGSANISGFKLKRQDNNSGPWMRPAGGKIANPNARSYTDEANLPDGTYSYQVRGYIATTNDQNLPLSQIAVAVISGDGSGGDPPPPSGTSKPQNVTATVVGGTITVKWEWPFGTSNITGFKLVRDFNNAGAWMRPSGGKIANPNARSYTDETNLPDGKYSYKVRGYIATTSDQNLPLSETAATQINGSIALSKNAENINDFEDINEIPTDYTLSSNYPNPFNPSTVIEFAVPEESTSQLKIYDLLGKEVAVLLDNQTITAGKYRYTFTANNLPSGMYLYVFSSQSTKSGKTFNETQKMMLLK